LLTLILQIANRKKICSITNCGNSNDFDSLNRIGFIKTEELGRLKTILSKAYHYAYLPTDYPSLDELLESSDLQLSDITPSMCCIGFFSHPNKPGYNLRSRCH